MEARNIDLRQSKFLAMPHPGAPADTANRVLKQEAASTPPRADPLPTHAQTTTHAFPAAVPPSSSHHPQQHQAQPQPPPALDPQPQTEKQKPPTPPGAQSKTPSASPAARSSKPPPAQHLQQQEQQPEQQQQLQHPQQPPPLPPRLVSPQNSPQNSPPNVPEPAHSQPNATAGAPWPPTALNHRAESTPTPRAPTRQPPSRGWLPRRLSQTATRPFSAVCGWAALQGLLWAYGRRVWLSVGMGRRCGRLARRGFSS